jgi:hypothetical protein
MKEVLEEQYPNAQKVILVMDNLNTHMVNSANVRRFLRRMGGASARNMGIDLADLRKMA